MPSEISAAFALEQIKKLKKNISIRIRNFNKLKEVFLDYNQIFDLPEMYLNVRTGWLAFPLVLKKNSKYKRKDLQIFLEKNNIQTRTVFTGNIIKQPVFKGINYKKNIEGYKESNHIMKNGMLIGCHHGMGIKEIYFIKQKINEFLKINNENIVYKF